MKLKICKACKTPHGCREDKECYLESQQQFEKEQLEEIEDKVETVMNNYNQYGET